MSTEPKRPRARDIGIVIGELLKPGKLNSITDVPRVKVGTAQKIAGNLSSKDEEERKKIVRAGVTIIGTDDIEQVPLYAGVGILQGSGELTGSIFIKEGGELTCPIAISGTMHTGRVYDAINGINPLRIQLPVVGETYDRMTHPLSHSEVSMPDLVSEAVANMSSESVQEGNVGGGTGMVSFGLKGGTGSSSRIVPGLNGTSYTVGVLVQANHGSPYDLVIGGKPVGKILDEEGYTAPWFPTHDAQVKQLQDGEGRQHLSIIVIVATDAPLLPHQCSAVARRAGVGISRGGGGNHFFSGDIFLCFSTARPETPRVAPTYETRVQPITTFTVNAVHNETLDFMFRAAADATEEAVLNALFAADDLEGYTGRKWRSLPVDRVREIVQQSRS
ncbi:unnamed protein product [Mycena citricolor]|uniref:Uncharacterized protein n=1 Tax=Mycena citricolor TaxID=2018698 RepID=A0AAD2HJD1_9AGAR|nr:unnamed protein product [Mycena citricolor]CAK5275117.1 unnamed protein product [Mycena citricolor]